MNFAFHIMNTVVAKLFRSEKLFIVLMAIIVLVFNLAPYINQRSISFPDKTYVGSFPIVIDKSTYLAEMTQGEEGNWLMINKYTSEPQKPAFIYTFYIFLGHIAKFLGVSVETTFFISRFVFGIIFLLTIIYFIRYFVCNKTQRIITWLLVLFSSGLGWFISNQNSVDVWNLEAMPMVRFSYFPHITFANTLLLITILLTYDYFCSQKLFSLIAAGTLAFVLNLVLPYHGFLLYAVILLFLLINIVRGGIKTITTDYRMAVFFVISLPSFVYLLYLVHSNPIWAAVNKSAILEPRPFIYFVTGFGLLFLFSIVGIYSMYKRKNEHFLIFFLWIFVALFLAYAPIIPIQKQRVLETGIYVPFAITAGFGVMEVYRYLATKKIEYLRLKFIILAAYAMPLMLIGNVQNWISFDYLLRQKNDERFYLSTRSIEAMKWLRQNTPNDSIILSSFYNGNVIPYYANRFVYVGHGPMTINFEEKVKESENFYFGNFTGGEVVNFLENKKINYVFYSEEEKKMGKFNPQQYDFLEKVYQNNTAEIYKVKI